MTSRDADPLVVRPQPTQDDAVPNANGVFAEALVRLAQLTGTDGDRHRASDFLTRLTGIARSSPLGHTSVLNALDLHLRGLTILVTGNDGGPLFDTGLRIPYPVRSVRWLPSDEGLDDKHPAKALASSNAGPQALVCAGMRCSLPVLDAAALKAQAAEMLMPGQKRDA